MNRAIKGFAASLLMLLCMGAGPGGGPGAPGGGGGPPPGGGIPGIPRPIQLRIETYVGHKPEGLVPETTWKVNAKQKQYVLYVTKIQVLTGSVAYYDVEQAASPYPIAFTLDGPDKVMSQLAATPPGQKIALTAYLSSLGARRLLIGGLEEIPAAK